MKTAEQVREEAAKVAEGLEARWRSSAEKQQAIADRAWIGGSENRKQASILNAGADGCAAIAKLIRKIQIDRYGPAQ